MRVTIPIFIKYATNLICSQWNLGIFPQLTLDTVGIRTTNCEKGSVKIYINQGLISEKYGKECLSPVKTLSALKPAESN